MFAAAVRILRVFPVRPATISAFQETNNLHGLPAVIRNSRSGRKVERAKEGREVSLEISGTAILPWEVARDVVFDVFRKPKALHEINRLRGR